MDTIDKNGDSCCASLHGVCVKCEVQVAECGELVNTKMWKSSLWGIRGEWRQNCEMLGVSLIMYR